MARADAASDRRLSSRRAGSTASCGYYSYRTLRDYPLIVTVGVAEQDVLLASSQRRARNYLGAGAGQRA